jgi:hypothetical protein
MHVTPRAAAVAALAAGVLATGGAAPGGEIARAPTELRVHAGAYLRQHTPIELDAAGLAAGTYELRDQSAARVALQVDRAQRARFVLPSLAARAERVYTIHPASPSAGPAAAAARDADNIHVVVHGRPVLTYVGGAGRLPSPEIKPAYRRGGYIHPVRTPSGRTATDDYPSDHYHQHGVMMAWTSVVFQGRKTDFWNMGSSLGRVEAVGAANVQSGPVFAGWQADHHYLDLTSGSPKLALRERWQVRAYAIEQMHVFDIDVQQEAWPNQPVLLPEYHYGGMAVRGAASFRGDPGNAIVLTSEGHDRVRADASRARWAHMGGRVDGALVGVAMLGHPDNFRAPEPLRVHPTDPYLCFAPSRLGAWSITASAPLIARYRFVATDGPADAALLDRLWRDYAQPPSVTLK